jgi:hypothetical protein
MKKKKANAPDLGNILNAFVDIIFLYIKMLISVKNLILHAIIALAKDSLLFLQDLKNVECIGYLEEKTLMS